MGTLGITWVAGGDASVKWPLFNTPEPSLLWLESHRICAGAQRRAISGFPTEDQLAQALTVLPQGPTRWVVDDLWSPSTLLRDLAELPHGAEASEAFFQWRFNQAMALDEPHFVQAIEVEPGLWLAAGMREETRNNLLQLGTRLDRTIYSLTPRWLHLFNLLAPSQDLPGMLLSLSPAGDGRYSGTLAAWGRTLCLIRHWPEPLDIPGWVEERIVPSAAFLHRESRTPKHLFVWGAAEWPDLGLPVHSLDDAFVFGEAR
jgi:hypothetical protein